MQQQQSQSNSNSNTIKFQYIHPNGHIQSNQHNTSMISQHQSSQIKQQHYQQIQICQQQQQQYQTPITYNMSYKQYSKLMTKINLYKQKFNEKFQYNMNNPTQLIEELLGRLQQIRVAKQKYMNKYGEIQIQMREMVGQIYGDCQSYGYGYGRKEEKQERESKNFQKEKDKQKQREKQRQRQRERQRQKIKSNFKKCLQHHNIWSSRNGMTMMIADTVKRVQIFGNMAHFTKKNKQKLNVNLAIFNKIPQNSIFQIKLRLIHFNIPLLQKQDYIRLKLYPGDFSSTNSNSNSDLPSSSTKQTLHNHPHISNLQNNQADALQSISKVFNVNTKITSQMEIHQNFVQIYLVKMLMHFVMINLLNTIKMQK